LIVNVDTAKLNSVDIDGYLGELSGSSAINISSSGASTIIRLDGTVSYDGQISIDSFSTADIQLYSGGSTIANFLNNGSGIITQFDNIIGGTLYSNSGGWVTGDFSLQVNSITFMAGSLSLGASSVVSNNGVFQLHTSVVLDAGTSTITINNDDPEATSGLYLGDNHTFYNVELNGDGGLGVDITGTGVIFNDMTIAPGSTASFYPLGSTYTFSSFTSEGTVEKQSTLTNSGDGGDNPILLDASGTNTLKYCDIDGVDFGGGATWNAYLSDGNTVTNSNGSNQSDPVAGEPDDKSTGDGCCFGGLFF